MSVQVYCKGRYVTTGTSNQVNHVMYLRSSHAATKGFWLRHKCHLQHQSSYQSVFFSFSSGTLLYATSTNSPVQNCCCKLCISSSKVPLHILTFNWLLAVCASLSEGISTANLALCFLLLLCVDTFDPLKTRWTDWNATASASNVLCSATIFNFFSELAVSHSALASTWRGMREDWGAQDAHLATTQGTQGYVVF